MRARLLEFLACCPNNNTTATTSDEKKINSALETRRRQGRCLAALLRSCDHQFNNYNNNNNNNNNNYNYNNNIMIIPPPRWRRRYGRWVPIGPEGVEALCELLLTHQEKEININKNLSNIKEEKEKYIKGEKDGIINITTTRMNLSLDLHGLRILDDGVRALSPLFSFNKDINNNNNNNNFNIVSLILSGNNITDHGLTTLVAALSDNPTTLKRLILNDNPVTIAGLLPVIRFCTNCTINLTELSLSRAAQIEISQKNQKNQKQQINMDKDKLHDNLLEKLEDALVQMLHFDSKNKLTSFIYKGSDNEDFDALAFGSLLHTSICKSKLQHLALYDCYNTIPTNNNNNNNKEILCESSDALATPFRLAAAGLSSNITLLKTLELQIPLTEEATRALTTGISEATCLTKLNLRGCNMSAESLNIFAEAIKNNSTLISLDISHQSNEIAHPVCEGYWPSQILSGRINNNNNNINTKYTCRPLLPIMKALHYNKTLQELIVLGIDIVNDDIEELCACIERSGNTSIRTIRHTGINSKPLAIKLESLLSRNNNNNNNNNRNNSYGRSISTSYDGGNSSITLSIDRTVQPLPIISTSKIRKQQNNNNINNNNNISTPPQPHSETSRLSILKPIKEIIQNSHTKRTSYNNDIYTYSNSKRNNKNNNSKEVLLSLVKDRELSSETVPFNDNISDNTSYNNNNNNNNSTCNSITPLTSHSSRLFSPCEGNSGRLPSLVRP